jgi:hypothetical protein
LLLCCAVLCCAVMCCAVLCCAVCCESIAVQALSASLTGDFSAPPTDATAQLTLPSAGSGSGSGARSQRRWVSPFVATHSSPLKGKDVCVIFPLAKSSSSIPMRKNQLTTYHQHTTHTPPALPPFDVHSFLSSNSLFSLVLFCFVLLCVAEVSLKCCSACPPPLLRIRSLLHRRHSPALNPSTPQPAKSLCSCNPKVSLSLHLYSIY